MSSSPTRCFYFTSSPENYAIDVAKEKLGYEDWEPPRDLLVRLRKALPSSKYGDVSEVLQCLLEWDEETSHMIRITNLLSETEPRRLSHQEEANLRGVVRQRWPHGGQKFSILLVVEDWLAENH